MKHENTSYFKFVIKNHVLNITKLVARRFNAIHILSKDGENTKKFKTVTENQYYFLLEKRDSIGI